MENGSARRVLFITGSAAAGGGPRHLLDWLEALHKYSASDIQIYTAAPGQGLFAEPLRAIGVQSLVIPEKSVSLFRLFALLRFARKNKIDLVHSFGRAGGIYGRFLGLFGFKVLHTPQGLISTPLTQVLYDLTELFLKPLTKKYIFGSRSEAEEGRLRFGALEGVIIPPIVAPPENSVPRELRDRCGEALDSGRPIVIGTIGRFVSHKRVVTLTRAILSLGRGFKLQLYGDGGESAVLKDLAKKSDGLIEICGLVDRWQALREIDIFVSWSKSESFGLAAAEAMSVGIPCILSDAPGHRDLAEGEKCAWLFKGRAKSDFSRALAQLLRDKNDRKARIFEARKAIELTCGPLHIAQVLLDIYRHEQTT